MKRGIKRKRIWRIVLSLIMINILLSLTLMPSYEVKAYSSKDKNGNITLSPTGDIKINLLVAAIDPTLTSLDSSNYHNGKKTIKASEYFGYSLDDSLEFWINSFEEISHNRVEFNVVEKVTINEFPKYINGKTSLNNTSFQKIFKKDSNGFGDWYGGIGTPEFKPYDTAGELDYDYYIDKLNLVKRKNNNEFDMLFLIGIDPLSPYETCMVGRNPIWINGGTFERNCDNFVIVTPTFSRPDGSIEDIGHMAEHMLGYTYGMIGYDENCIDGSDYSALNDWQKYCLCKFLATPDTKIYGYGMVHFSPNSEKDYEWNKNTKVKYYKNWKEGKDIQYFTADTTYLADGSMFNYSYDPCISHHKWWFYNMPYEDGRDENGYYKNWWRYIFTFNYVSDIVADESYPDSTILMNIGNENALKFRVIEQSGNTFSTDVKSSSAAVEILDKSIIAFNNGNIKALKTGKTKIIVKLDGKSVEYSILVEDKKDSKEQVEAFVKRFYKEIMGREAEQAGLDYYTDILMNKEQTGAQIAYNFVHSPEFMNAHYTDDVVVAKMYDSFFDRKPGPKEYEYWMDKFIDGYTLEQVLSGFTDSGEFQALCDKYGIERGTLGEVQDRPLGQARQLKFGSNENLDEAKVEEYIVRMYKKALGRTSIAPEEIAYWKSSIMTGKDPGGKPYDPASVASDGFLNSKEYLDKNKTDEEFIFDCYQAFFDRTPGTIESDYWLDRMHNNGYTRKRVVLEGFGTSPEFQNLLKTYGFEVLDW